jgi:hypothetical protein
VCSSSSPFELVSQNLLSLEAFPILSFYSCFCFVFCSDFTVSVFHCATAWFFHTCPNLDFTGSCSRPLVKVHVSCCCTPARVLISILPSDSVLVCTHRFLLQVSGPVSFLPFSPRATEGAAQSQSLFFYSAWRVRAEPVSPFPPAVRRSRRPVPIFVLASSASICSPFFLRLFTHGASQSLLLVFVLPDSVWLVIFLSPA